jgi:hypothetical protein
MIDMAYQVGKKHLPSHVYVFAPQQVRSSHDTERWVLARAEGQVFAYLVYIISCELVVESYLSPPVVLKDIYLSLF